MTLPTSDVSWLASVAASAKADARGAGDVWAMVTKGF
jgi:hypothetical protein